MGLFRWVFRKELDEMEKSIQEVKQLQQRYSQKLREVDDVLAGTQVSVDVNMNSRSWACISIQGKKNDFIKFIDLGESDIRDIQNFLRNFDRSRRRPTIDAPFGVKDFLRF